MGMKSVRAELPPVENPKPHLTAPQKISLLQSVISKSPLSTLSLGPSGDDKFFAFTFAKVEKGELKGYGDLFTGDASMRRGGLNYLEVAWAKTDKGWAWVMVSPGGRSSEPKVDAFFGHLTIYSHARADGMRPEITRPEYHGLFVLAAGQSKTSGGSPVLLSMKKNFDENLKGVDHALLLLYREFDKKEDYFAYLDAFKKEKAALQAAE
jgi:hypothetical protein